MSGRSTALALATGAALVAAPSFAEPPSFDLPIACELGVSCYIEDYVDIDPSDELRDYRCGLKTRDGHRGTDIVLLSFEAMEAGVPVLAAAVGKVAAIRDGVPDQAVTATNRASVEGRECGNGVRINHGDGWQTLYCHMAQGSIAVAQGQSVAAGAPLGMVGLSGLTNIPHVHFSVLKDGEMVDPFLAEPGAECGTAEGNGLWTEAPGYDRAGLFTAGFSTAVPNLEAVQTGAARAERADAQDNLVLYGHAFYAETGDVLEFRVSGPEGEVFTDTEELEDPQVQIMRAYGRRSPEGGWMPGNYRGYVTLTREGRVIATRHADISIGE